MRGPQKSSNAVQPLQTRTWIREVQGVLPWIHQCGMRMPGLECRGLYSMALQVQTSLAGKCNSDLTNPLESRSLETTQRPAAAPRGPLQPSVQRIMRMPPNPVAWASPASHFPGNCLHFSPHERSASDALLPANHRLHPNAWPWSL